MTAPRPVRALTEAVREISTNEVAGRLGISPNLLRKWKARGLLPKAPGGVSGQGRGNQCFWSAEAIEEARTISGTRKARQGRKHPAGRDALDGTEDGR